MAFREVNPKKLAFLLSNGAHEGELKKFFTESKTQLLLKGAKVQNIPHGREERIRAISEKLSSRTEDVLQSWFKKNVSVAVPTSLDEVLLYLEAHFDENEAIPEAEVQLICRSALVDLFSDSPNDDLLRLLQRPIGVTESGTRDVVSIASDEPVDSNDGADELGDVPPISGASPLQNYQLAELLASVVCAGEIAVDDALVPFGRSTRVLVEALMRVRDGEIGAAKEQLALLHPDEPEFGLIQSAIGRARHQSGTSTTPIGIRVVVPPSLDGDHEANAYEIVGIFTNESDTGAIFVLPIYLILNGQLHLLSKDDRNRMFPDSGSVMTHRSILRSSLKRRELVHWRVSERDGAEGRTRFHMEAELAPLIEVVRVHVPSSDVDEVRTQIKSMAENGLLASGRQTMFVLMDGVAVTSPKGVDLSRDEAFEQPWQAWVSLETWLIEGHQYCLDVPRGIASSLDLSPLDAAFRRLLKDLQAIRGYSMTKTQRREIAELLRSKSGGEIASRASRIASSIDQIAINEREMDEVLVLLGSHVEVRRRVDDLVAAEIERRQSDRAGLQEEIASLRKKKVDLEREGRDIARSNSAKADAVASSVRDAFANAIRDGAATLANAKIFHLLGGAAGEVTPQEAVLSRARSDDAGILGGLTQSDVTTRLSVLGINRRKALLLSALLDISDQCGTALILKGNFARHCAATLVRNGRDSVAVIEIPMGLTSGDFLRQHLERFAGIDAVALQNADLSAFEIYGVDLLDRLVEQAISKQSLYKRVVMSCVNSDISLPIPLSLRRTSLIVDLDSPWDESAQVLDEIDPTACHLLPAIRDKVFDLVSGMQRDGRVDIERALVNAVSLK